MCTPEGWSRISVAWRMAKTADYARHVFERHATLQQSPRDTEAAVRARMKRQEWLYRAGKRLNVLMSESVLWGRICPPDVLAAQLDRLLGVVGMDTVNLGSCRWTARCL
ncbi:Scr1 family TA system antitoxin-like transcriptional regulator [Streptomyces sp. enrichment culture]|uniref:Scr1 family TA system antitoxin-like transcriptional regulator n=1 Tax=Streptomyces sp. enrichment culture TaxID=1795815 RepID=UPI003F55DA9D